MRLALFEPDIPQNVGAILRLCACLGVPLDVIEPCGFVFVGTDGTISSPDYADHVTVQTRARPQPHPVAAEPLPAGRSNPIEYVLGCIDRNEPVSGPLAPDLCLTAQRIVDTAARSAQEKRTLELVP